VRRALLVLAVTLGLLVLTPSPSWACSCATATTKQYVDLAGTVASGTVDWTASDGQTRTYQVDVDAVYKGSAATSEKLVTNAQESACGLADLAPGRRYMFFIDGVHPGSMRVGLCGGTVAYDRDVAERVAAVTGPPSAPAEDRASRSTTEPGSSRTTRGVGVAAGLLLLTAIGAVVLRRRS
jgi:hypothetical protein